MGIIPGIVHEIDTGDQGPVILKPYSVPYALRAATKAESNRLEERGIIRKSISGWNSPVFPKQNKNGEIRLLIDSREVNKITMPIVFPNPGIEETPRGLSGSQIYTKLDLRQGYYQIKMAHTDIPKSGFVILNEHYEYIRMPQDLMNAPKTFQKIMTIIFGDLPYVKIYLEDLLIHSKNEEQHLTHFFEVKRRISDNNISINIVKSEFMKPAIEFLGKKIDNEGRITVNLQNFTIERLYRPPKTRRQLQAVFGFINW